MQLITISFDDLCRTDIAECHGIAYVWVIRKRYCATVMHTPLCATTV